MLGKVWVLLEMQGARDHLHSVVYMEALPTVIVLKKEDTTDMLWEIPSVDVQQPLTWALGQVRRAHQAKKLGLSVSKDNRSLDMVGKTTNEDFVVNFWARCGPICTFSPF